MARGDDSEPDALPLLPGSGAGESRATDAAYPGGELEYRLAGPLPDLGDTAPAYHLVSAPIDENAVRRMADALELEGNPTEVANGWQVSDDDGRVLDVMMVDGVRHVSYNFYDTDTAPGSTGSAPPDASGGSSGAGTSGISEPNVGAAPSDGREPAFGGGTKGDADPAEPNAPTTTIVAPDLPSESDAKAAARALLSDMGMAENEWKVEVRDGGAVGASCAAPDTPTSNDAADSVCVPDDTSALVTSRDVVFSLVVDELVVPDIGWTVSFGDASAVTAVYGVDATPERIADYPLRSTQEVYDSLVAGDAAPGQRVPAVDTNDDGVQEDLDARTDASEPAPDITTEPDTLPQPQSSREPGTLEAPSTGAEPGTDPGAEPDIAPGPDQEPTAIVVTVTGAERALLAMPGLDGKTAQRYLVPSYRFAGTYPDGSKWETTLVAVDDDYIAPPPSVAPTDDPPAIDEGDDAVSGPSGEIAEGPSNLVLYVSNQSFEIDPVDITIAIDGETVVNDEFNVDSQHTWVDFGFRPEAGQHTIDASSNTGDAQASKTVATGATGEAPVYVVVNYWGANGFTFDVSTEPPVFA